MNASNVESGRPVRSWMLGVVLLAGAILRLIQYFERRSLWGDEAMLSLNVAARDWRGLLDALDYDQAAPVLFLWAQRGLVDVLGVNEFSLRLISLAAGLVIAWLTWKLASRILAPTHALIATALVSLSPMLVRYANEAKPYGLDAVVSVSLALLTANLVKAPNRRVAWVLLLVGGLVAIGVSTPAIFVLAGAGSAILLAPSVHEDRSALVRLGLMSSAWIVATALIFFLIYRPAAESRYMLEFWEGAFLKLGSDNLLARAWTALSGVMSGIFVGTLDAGRWGALVMHGVESQAVIAALLCVLGAYGYRARQDWWVGALLAVPVLAALGASALGFYPITIRLMLFAVPGLLVLMVRGIVEMAAWFPARTQRLVVSAFALFFVAPPLGRGVLTSISPIRQQDTRPVIEEFVRRAGPGDPVYIYAAAVPAWTFYTTDWNHPDSARLRWMASVSSSGGDAFPNKPPRGHAVENEGKDLVYSYAGHQELIGVGTGRPVRWGPGEAVATIDAGWADNEADRMQRAGGRVWLVFMPIWNGDREPNLSELRAAVARRGGKMAYEFHRREADLFLYEF